MKTEDRHQRSETSGQRAAARDERSEVAHLGSRITHHSSRSTHWPLCLLRLRITPYSLYAFTLIELLVVISIIAILAAIAMPVTRQLKPDPLAAATRQLMDDLALARRHAIADHTTVYVLFLPSVNNLPPGLSSTPGFDYQPLAKGQFTSYALYEKRQIGDQPGRPTARFVTDWRTLPAGTMIATQKFGFGLTPPSLPVAPPTPPAPGFNFRSFNYTYGGFFTLEPESNAVPANLPSIAFDYKGSLASPWEQWHPPTVLAAHDPQSSGGFDAVIPLTQGAVNPVRLPPPATGYAWQAASVSERPSGGWTNLYNNIVIDGPTGRARVDRRAVR